MICHSSLCCITVQKNNCPQSQNIAKRKALDGIIWIMLCTGTEETEPMFLQSEPAISDTWVAARSSLWWRWREWGYTTVWWDFSLSNPIPKNSLCYCCTFIWNHVRIRKKKRKRKTLLNWFRYLEKGQKGHKFSTLTFNASLFSARNSVILLEKIKICLIFSLS